MECKSWLSKYKKQGDHRPLFLQPNRLRNLLIFLVTFYRFGKFAARRMDRDKIQG